MGEKDKTEKLFVGCKEIFAELINVLIYAGKGNVEQENLLPGPTESIYRGKRNELHNQFRDCSMYEMSRDKVYALYNVENQSRIDPQMVLRCVGYDGAAYRSQYQEGENIEIYPVISIVLNWGTTPWNTALSIREMMNRSLPKELEEYISDNKLHVFDMRYLDKTTKNLFQGDIRIVLDYLTDRESLLKRNQVLKHPEETLRMLYALTEDDRYLENIKLVKGGETKVCDLLDEAENRGIQKGIQKGIQQSLQSGIRILITTCKELGIDYDRTASKLKEKYALPEEEARKDMKLYW